MHLVNVNKVVCERSQCDRALGDDIRQEVWCKSFFMEMHNERRFCFPSQGNFICEPLDCAQSFTLPIVTGFHHRNDESAGPTSGRDQTPNGPRFMSLDEVKYENVEVLVVPTLSTMQKAAQSAPVEPGFKLSADWIKGFLNAPCSKTTHTASWFVKFVEWMSRPAETQRQYKWTFDAAVEWGFAFNVLVPVKAEGAIHRLLHRLPRGVDGRSTGQEVNGATVNWESPLLQPGGPGIVRCLCHQYMKRE